MIRLRFAPSPTGFLHVGNLRQVVFDYIIAKNLGGSLILRIEDTDQKREVPGAVEKLLDILAWMEIDFDEGPHCGGQYGPYIQSQRLDIYNEYVKQLLDSGAAYRCFCSAERLEEMRQRQQAEKLPPRYDRHCRDLSQAEIETKLKNGEKFVIRQRIPAEGKIVVVDELRGGIEFNLTDLDDHVLIKSNGIPTYHFASVVDDHLMKISHVVRGDEWLSSFPKNILLYQAFGWTSPKFIHAPLIINKGGGKLSKRQGDVSVENYRDNGYLPEALFNFCALQGWHPRNDQENLSRKEIIQEFNLADMGKSPAVFDTDKLDYLNGWNIRRKSPEELLTLCLPFLQKAGLIAGDEEPFMNQLTGEKISREFLNKVVLMAQERLKKLSDIPALSEFLFQANLDYDREILAWKNMTADQARQNLTELKTVLAEIAEADWNKERIEQAVLNFIQTKNLKNGEVLWPLRVALSGSKTSPGPFEIADALGREMSLSRLSQAI